MKVKRILSLFLVLVLCLSTFMTQGLAVESGSGGAAVPSEVVVNSHPATGNLNLTEEGTLDWVHLGKTDDRKNITAPIITYENLGSGTPSDMGDSPVSFSWTDGKPTTSANNIRTGKVFTANHGTSKDLPAGENGWKINVPSDDKERVLMFTAGAWACAADITVTEDVYGATPAYTGVLDARELSEGEPAKVMTYKIKLQSGKAYTVKGIFTEKTHNYGNLSLGAIALGEEVDLPELPFNVNDAKVNGDKLELSVGVLGDKLTLEVLKTNLVKVYYQPKGKASEQTLMIGKKTWDTVGAVIDTDSDPMTITTSDMVVKISKLPCRISVFDKSGKLLIKEPETGGLASNGITFDYNTDAGTNFYGIGGYNAWENSSSGMLRNNGGNVHAGQQGDNGGPLIYTTNYGVLVDSNGGKYSTNNQQISFTGGSREDVECYIIVGQPKTVVSTVNEIGGGVPMFPKWAMGFTNSEWNINQTELNNIVDTYRQKQIPIDNYTLDFDWKAWGEDNYGESRWNTTKFPDGPSGKLRDDMDAKGIKLTGILKPRLIYNNPDGSLTAQAKYAEDNDLWLPNTKPYNEYFSGRKAMDLDFSKQLTREWYWEHLKDAYNTGMVGWWNDEADIINGVLCDNFQFMNMQRALYEGQRNLDNNRAWSINRNYYIGANRYAYALWSGDIKTGFATMKAQRERMLSAVNIGAIKWGMDTGGFSGHPDSENYARWMQFSAFTPVFRVHGTNNEQRQPWVYGEKAEAAAKAAGQLRYKLIPYIYNYERVAYESGLGLVRPLFYDYPEDPNVANYVDAWMFGDYMLVSPVVDQGQTSKSIYLPVGTWIDYFKGTAYDGGQAINYAVNATTWEDIPLFIKKGAIIPTQEFMNYVGEKPVDKIYLDVFPDTTQTSFRYYDDDGATYDYEDGKYFIQNMTTKDNGSTVDFNIGAKNGTYNPSLQYYIIKIHQKTGRNTVSNLQELTKYSSYDALVKADGEGWATGSDVYGDVTYVKVAAGAAKNIQVNISDSGTGEKVATPTASPAPGTYIGTQTVVLSCTTDGAVIYYTTDGTTPTTSSTQYNGNPITVSSSRTINAIAVKAGMANSDVATLVFTINNGGGSSGGSSSGGGTAPSPVTQINNGSTTTVTNIQRLVSENKTLTVVDDEKGAQLVFDTDALEGISSQATENIQVEINDVSEEHKENLPGKMVFSLTVSSGGRTISNFGGKVKVSLPYELKEGERPEDVTVWHIAEDDTMTEISCIYDPVTQLATFEVTHFSFYVVGVAGSKQEPGTEPWSNPFKDVKESDWYYEAVKFTKKKGLFAGTGSDTFSPAMPMTRAMFWRVLFRLDGNGQTGSGELEAARAWAMEKGISDGYTPDNSITREQMISIIWRYAGSPKTNGDLSQFNDADSVASYAVDAMAWAVENGIIVGSNGALLPKENTTRAQVAAVLQRFSEK